MNRKTLSGLCMFLISIHVAIAVEIPSGDEFSSDFSARYSIGKPGLFAEYRIEDSNNIPKSNVRCFSVHLGSPKNINGEFFQWLRLRAEKENGEHFSVWILSKEYPSKSLKQSNGSIVRYIVREENHQAAEYCDRYSSGAVLPCLGAWEYLFPQTIENALSDRWPARVQYLGKTFLREKQGISDPITPPDETKILNLSPDTLIGVPHNTKQKDGTRRYDDSEYEYVRLTKNDYDEMIEAGMTCFRADPEQVKWIEYQNVFYWGISGKDIHYPEDLYRSNYLGPLLFLDEPGVCTRDHVIRPRLRDDPAFRKSITPQYCFEEFVKYFDEAKNQKNPTVLLRVLESRPDVDIGNMKFLQQNLYTWETMVSTALHQLSEDRNGPPASIVFEPPGRIGSKRTLPEMNMNYQCQIPIDSPKNLTDIIYGFLRGAARSTNKDWGTSIYGSVDRDEASWFLTHAYDLGAKLFFFWDSHRLACVPYNECLAMTRTLRNHINHHPFRDIKKLRQAAEIALLIPPGYNLGHVYMGKGILWGVGELNLERMNPKGVKYRTVMKNLFTEIERCLRLGIAFDLFWDLPSFHPAGYREIVRIHEDGSVEVNKNGESSILSGPRIPARPEGDSPQMVVDLSAAKGSAPLEITARAHLTEGSSLIYYSSGANQDGIYLNAKVFWELYGPEEEDYRTLSHAFLDPSVQKTIDQRTVEIKFTIEHPGQYRLRAATCDLAGRTAETWKSIRADE